MTFGVATITTPKASARGRKFNCGKYGELTAKQISQLAGISKEAVWQRVRAGYNGAALVAPKHESLRKAKAPCRRPTVLVAMKLARAFPDRVPSIREIRKVHPMCERNAMRWRQAMLESIRDGRA